jgi:asparagine synthase (glutamine-hydrolysing)
MKVRGRSLRYIQVRLAERYLPESVLKRPKQGFSSALPYMLKEEYKHLYRVLLSSSRLADDGFFRQDAIDRLVNEHSRQKTDHGNRLWLLINSEVWYRMHIKGCSIAELDDVINATLPAADNASDRESGSTRL